jgi:pimeloyl-ACP methyl ester carboxylesterase
VLLVVAARLCCSSSCSLHLSAFPIFSPPLFAPYSRIALLNLDRVASLALISGNAGGWFWSNFPTLELIHAAIDLIRTGFHERVAAEVSLRLHYTSRFLSEHVIDEESGEKRLRRDHYRMRYLHGIRRDAARDQNGSVFWGHLAAVRSHNLTKDEAEALHNATFEKVVIFGEDDRVVPPEASKDLARRIGATVRSVRGAHFIVDESAHEVNAALGELWKTSPLPEQSPHFVFDSYILRSLAACRFLPA